MKCDKNYMRLYAVTDRTWLNGRTLESDIEKAILGGVTCVQLREKELDYNSFLKEAYVIKALCKKYNVPFFINDNVELAVVCGADGVHIGQHDMPVEKARKIIGDKMILGVSAQTVEEAVDAEKKGADCLGVGAVFSTSTKLDADSVSKETLKEICEAVSIPVVAIGGITDKNILELKGTGIAGIALVSAIFASSDIKSECEKLLSLSNKL